MRLHKGDVLVTVATGELSDLDADRTGLVPSHAYAVLDVRKINVSKTKVYKLLLIYSFKTADAIFIITKLNPALNIEYQLY